MTELEKQLLSALELLQQDYSRRLDEWDTAFAEWRKMSGLMQQENAVHELEQASAEFERAAAPVIRSLNVIEQCQEQESQNQKQLTRELQQEKTYKGPTLG